MVNSGIIDSGVKIVTSGLVYWYDASQIRSYPTTGRTWSSLAAIGTTFSFGTMSSHSGTTFSNVPVYSSSGGGSFTFPPVASSSYPHILLSGTQPAGLSQATWISWVKPNGAQTSLAGLVISRSSGANGMLFDTNNAVRLFWQSSLFLTNTGVTYSQNQWQMISGVIQATPGLSYAVAWVNTKKGLTLSAPTVLRPLTGAFTTAYLGWDPANGTRTFKGDFGIFMMYNRALSDTEITQNYNALRSRYGL